MANKVPEKMINFRVYADGGIDHIGVADGELMSLESMTETISGAGIAGEVDTPTLGHYSSTTLTLNWRTVSKSFMGFTEQRAYELDLRAANQVFDAGSGTYDAEALRVVCRAVPKTIGLGNLTVATSAGSSTEFEVIQMRVYVGGSEVFEFDKYNYINTANGTDYLKAIRNALGMN